MRVRVALLGMLLGVALGGCFGSSGSAGTCAANGVGCACSASLSCKGSLACQSAICVDPSSGGSGSSARTAQASVGADGGTVALSGGATLEVPAHALTVDTQLTISVTEHSMLQGSAPTGVDSAGDGFSFGPANVALQYPVTVTIPRPSGANVVLRLRNGKYELVDAVTIVEGFLVFQTDELGTFVAGTQKPPAGAAAVKPKVCDFLGVLEPGAAAASKTRFLCDPDFHEPGFLAAGADGNLHILASRFPKDFDLQALASQAAVGIADLNVAKDALAYGVAYAWVDDGFVGRIPRENELWSCASCGLPCLDWLTLVLPAGLHTLRIETYGSELCTQHFNQSSVICGNDFNADTSITGLYDDTFTVSLGACRQLTVSPTPSAGGSDGCTTTETAFHTTEKLCMRNGVLDGPYERYDSSGRIVEKGTYTKGKKTDTWTTYEYVADAQTPSKRYEQTYSATDPDSYRFRRYVDEVLREEGGYAVGGTQMDGNWKTYHGDDTSDALGLLAEERNYDKGKKVGKWTVYNVLYDSNKPADYNAVTAWYDTRKGIDVCEDTVVDYDAKLTVSYDHSESECGNGICNDPIFWITSSPEGGTTTCTKGDGTATPCGSSCSR